MLVPSFRVTRQALCFGAALLVAVNSLSAQSAASLALPLDSALSELRRGAATGGVVAVVAGERTVLLEAIGRVGYDEGSTRVAPDQLFGTVEFHHVLTALAAALLVERHLIQLDAPIREYAPDLPPRLGAVTIAQLLSHTAGLDDAEDERPRRPRSTLWAGATDRALFTEPGSIHSTSRHGNRLVRRILEQQTGKQFTELVQELILEPAGMMRSTFDPARAEQLGVVPAHAVSTSIAQPMVRLTPTANPYQPLYSTAGDLARLVTIWLNRGVLQGERVFPASVFDAIETARAARPASPDDSVGFAVRISRFHGLRELSYAGGPGGYGISVRLIPEARVGVVTLANATGTTLSRTAASSLLSALTAVGAPLPKQARATPPSAPQSVPDNPDAFAGTYDNGDRIIVLEVRQGELYWVDADLALPVQRAGSRFEALVADGRVAQAFHWTRDARGIAYLILGERAFRRRP